MTTPEGLHSEIAKADKILADMLSSHYPIDILRVTAALRCLSSYSKNSPDSEI